MKELLEGAREVVAALASEGVTSGVDGRIAVILPFTSILLLTESREFFIPLIALVASLPLLFEVYRKGGSLRLKALIMVSLFTLIVALPLIPTQPQNAFTFIAKVIACSTLFLGTVGYVGWPTMSEGIEMIIGIEGLSDALRLTLINSYIMLNELMKLIIAKNARDLGKWSYTKAWKSYSRAVGSLLEKAYEKSKRVEMAFSARNFGRSDSKDKTVFPKLLVLVHLIVIFAGLIDLVGV